jgi:hypothetical protein
LESIVNPKIQLNPWLPKLIETLGSRRAVQGDGESGVKRIQSLARIPDFVRHPALHLYEIRLSYSKLRADWQTMRIRLLKMTELVSSSSKVDAPTMKVYAHSQTGYGFVLALATILNSILRAFDPPDGTSLAEDSASIVHEIITLAERASPFRPLTASYIPICLTTAWAATDDISKRVELEKRLAEHQSDLADAQWLEGAVWLKAQYGSWRRKSSTLFPENNPLDLDSIIREPTTAKPANNSSCGVQ